MKIYILICLVLFTFTAYCAERRQSTGPVLYYECIMCTDVPTINGPEYPVLYKPVVSDWNNFLFKDDVLTLLKIKEFNNNDVKIYSEDAFLPGETKLILFDVHKFPVKLDTFGSIIIGNKVYKIDSTSLIRLDQILGKWKE